jgi:8-oxo-dGTP pyrophosphatase MutT (NUDIX family)/outer membrane lipoprotein SlyB
MTTPPHRNVPTGRRPHGSGDAWVEAPDGRKFWGRFGAAGLLVHDDRGVLLQHRVEWSHFGGTWGLPGGARHEGESAIEGALRESSEEAGVPASSLELDFTSHLDLGFWSYTTVVTTAVRAFDARIGDAESVELRWIQPSEIDTLPLHPGFASSWPMLRALVDSPISIVVDAANVVGSRPTGWWRDRAGAATEFVASLKRLSIGGVEGAQLGLSVGRYWPHLVVVLEGGASGAAIHDVEGSTAVATPPVTVVRADASGDDRVVQEATAARAAGRRVVVVTADRALRERVIAVDASVEGPRWLWALIEQSTTT